MRRSLRCCSVFMAVALFGAFDAAAEKSTSALTVAQTGALTLVNVREVVEGSEAATRRNDFESAFTYLADDVVITTSEPSPDGKTKTTTRGKAEFMKAERESLKQMPDSRYLSEITDVTLAPDAASATASVSAEQFLKSDGHEARGTQAQVLRIEMRKGKPAIVSVKSTMTGLWIDGTKVF
ncbi:MAG: hypothetical protein H7Y19_15095 [Luteimonas sp.]|nr:hypothetical protein [Luteimonas sp.]